MRNIFAIIYIFTLFVASAAKSVMANSVTDSVGGKPLTDVSVLSDRHGVLLREAIVQGHQYKFGVESPQMSAIALSAEQISTVPMVYGEPDLLKTVQRLPGVNSGKDGNSGIMVRGGGYDQNQLRIDGAMLYSTEHLKGFVTAVNPDIISSVAFYRGAFPAKFGGRLSSVIDVSAAEGDMNSYHGSVSAGLMMSRVSVSGPVVKGKTSFALAGRISYFDLILQPQADRHYKKLGVESPYTGLNFYDLNLKLAHRFSPRNKFTLTFIADHDHDASVTTPNSSKTVVSDYIDPYISAHPVGEVYDYSFFESGGENTDWQNMIGALNWYNYGDEGRTLHTVLSYSSYVYKKSISGRQESSRTIVMPGNSDSIPNAYNEASSVVFNSKISSAALKSEYTFKTGETNSFSLGAELSYTAIDPRRHVMSERDIYQDWCVKYYVPGCQPEILVDHRNEHEHFSSDSVVGRVSKMFNGNIYLSDSFKYGRLSLVGGLRVACFSVTDKNYLSLEPRLSLSFMIDRKSSVKLSYSRMTQAERLLTATNLVAPSDIWVPVTDSVPPMRSSVFLMSLNRIMPFGIEVSVEGYYKTISDLINYRDGVDFSRLSDAWQQMVAFGKGKAYGVELFAQKTYGNTTGWVSYTWSKAIGKFDNIGQMINSGREFYLPSDRRNNLSVSVSHRFNFNRFPGNHIDISAGYTFVTGRKVTLPDFYAYSGYLEMGDHMFVYQHGTSSYYDHHIHLPSNIDGAYIPSENFDIYLRHKGISSQNNVKLPDESKFDITVSMTVKHSVGRSMFTIGATNLLDKRNLSEAFIGTDDKGNIIIKGICNFPIMPVVSYSYLF